MGLAKRIIPCLDVTAGRVVKGVNFVGLRDAGDPVEVARRYDQQGADEVAFLDITASSDGRDLIVGVIEAVEQPDLVADAASRYGSQCIVVAVDAKRAGDAGAPRWEVHTHGGRRATGLDALEWSRRMERAGAGEILLTSMDRDGTRSGFDLELTRAVSDALSIPVIASGGVGSLDHLVDGVLRGRADAVLAASVFHYGEYTVRQAKEHMARHGIEVRL